MKISIIFKSLSLVLLVIIFQFCKKEEVPILSTSSVSNVTATSASGGGNITSDGGASVTVRGVCWSTTSNPTADGTHTSDGTGTGIFTSSLTSLVPGTTYYVRAYANNNAGTGYGNEVSFTTNPYELATITTNPTISITENIAISGGNITSDGGSAITARGVCWSTTPYPTIDGSFTIDGNGTGSFTSDIRCLYDETIYYIRAYATNAAGTSYGKQQNLITPKDPITFNSNLTYGMVSDIDGNCYKTIQIGDEIWMAENLRTSRYNDGAPILNVTDNTEWENLLSSTSNPPYITTGAYCWYNNDSAAYENVYGKLYNWGVVNSGKICPVGWHVPNWIDGLEGNPISGDCYLNGYLGGKLMEIGSTHWINPYSACINNETGFTAVPAGKRTFDGTFTDLGYGAYFWVPRTAGHGPLVINQKVPHSPSYCHSPTSCGIFPTEGHSIRCVKDQ